MRSAIQARTNVCLPCLLRLGGRTLHTASIDAPPDEETARSPPHSISSTSTRVSGPSSDREPGRQSPPLATGKIAGETNEKWALELSRPQQNELQILKRFRTHLGAKNINDTPIEHALESIPDLTTSAILQNAKTPIPQTLRDLYAGQKLGDVKKIIDQVIVHRKFSQRRVKNEETAKLLEQLGVLSIDSPKASSGIDSVEPSLSVESKDVDKSQATGGTQPVVEPQATSEPEATGETPLPQKHPLVRNVSSRIAASGAAPSSGRRTLLKAGGRITRRRLVKRIRQPITPPLVRPRKIEPLPKPEDTKESAEKTSEVFQLDPDLLKCITAKDLALKPLVVDENLQVPNLSFDLARVLFNPGVYELQDPRSRVYNFDPYLAQLMPVTEFNFDALNEYITSSEDEKLRGLAKRFGKRYTGSSSSMTGAISHFHFLLSAWRTIKHDNLSRQFVPESKNFTKINRGPNAVFLKYNDGVYAVDADKEYDSANILMSLGKSMEKLLTLEKEDFERYRKSDDPGAAVQALDSQPEQYHYGEIGEFLMRSQLDAHDPRLPGTGMFDLKTRAVAAVRMNIQNHEKGMDYEIKERFGLWESYEREYYDMMRSAFLKYSLQVRMGRMDGIFVAYHNIQRIFGFQYISLPEMDYALHGQTDGTLGDREFCFSVKLLNEIFDRATSEFPEQGLRFHFETREKTSVRNRVPYMLVFAEPVTEEQAREIQNARKAEIVAFEKRLFNAEPPAKERNAVTTISAETDEPQEESEPIDVPETSNHDNSETSQLAQHTLEARSPATQSDTAEPAPILRTTEPQHLPSFQSNAADTDFLDSLSTLSLPQPIGAESTSASDSGSAVGPQEEFKNMPLLGFKLIIRNKVNGDYVDRPNKLTQEDDWEIEYTLEQMEHSKAWASYIRCKARRKSVLSASEDDDYAASMYIRNLVELSRKGAKWRRKQDEIDAQRERVVLYEDRQSK